MNLGEMSAIANAIMDTGRLDHESDFEENGSKVSSVMRSESEKILYNGIVIPEQPSTSQIVSLDKLREDMLKRIAETDAFFKQQQRGDPDLSPREKYKIAEDLLNNKTSVFLTRYGEYLVTMDLEYFNDKSEDYVIGFQLNEIRQRLTKFANRTIVRNRRYEAMKELVEKGEYFGDEELKRRDPLLYEQMVGQYLDADEVNAQVDKADLRFSSILLKNMEMTENNVLYKAQRETEASQTMESDEDDSGDEGEESELESEEEEESKVQTLPPREKQMLREEFLSVMQLRFLNGEDEDFDYSKVDKNVDYDSLAIREHDEQEKYFDGDYPEDVDMDSASQTNTNIVSGDLRQPNIQTKA